MNKYLPFLFYTWLTLACQAQQPLAPVPVVPSAPGSSDASQIIGTLNTVINGLNNVISTLNTSIGSASRNNKVPLGFTQTWMPISSAISGTFSNTQWQRGTGAFLGVIELEDDYDAVQIGVGTPGTTGWTFTAGTVSASASYGGNTSKGVVPYDLFGNALTSEYPISWVANGANTNPWPGSTAQYLGTNAQGSQTIALSLSQAVASGATLTFATTVSDLRTGGAIPQVGMYAIDGLGCIPDNDQVTSVTGTTVVLTTGITTTCNSNAGLLNNQNIWFSWAPINAAGLTYTVPASTNPNEVQVHWSDWIPISSLPRVDGGIVAGMAATAACLPPNTTVQAVSITTVTFSNALNGTCTNTNAVTFTVSPALSVAAPVGAFFLSIPLQGGVQRGQVVTGTNIPPNTYVVGLDQAKGRIGLNNAITGPLAAGTIITLTNTAYVDATASSGNTLQFRSLSARPLLLLRAYATATGNTVAGIGRNGNDNVYEQTQGLPLWWFYLGGTAEVVAITTNATASGEGVQFLQAPIIAVRYLSRHRGATLMDCGDSHFEGDTTGGNNLSFTRLAQTLSVPGSFPIGVAHVTHGGTASWVFNATCYDMVQAVQPQVVVLQGWTANNGTREYVPRYQGELNSICNAVQAYGGRCILASEFPRQIMHTGQLYTASANTSNSVTLPLQSTVPVPANGTLSGVPISGCNIPVGTTAAIPASSNIITLSQPASVPGNCLVDVGDLIVAANVNNSTSVTFTSANWLPSAAYTVNGTGVSGSPTLTLTFNGNTGTFSSAQTLAAGTVLSMGTAQSAGGFQQFNFSLAQQRQLAAANNFLFLDSASVLEDPNNPGWFIPGSSSEGIHANDYGQHLVAPLLQRYIEQMVLQ